MKTSDLHLVADTEFKLIHDENGKLAWSWSNVKGERKRKVIKMLDEGVDQKGITESLSITKGYVSQIKKQAIKDGLLTPKCKLTPSGFDYVSDR